VPNDSEQPSTVSNDSETTWHREIAVGQFNRTWDLIEAAERTEDDNVEMLTAAMTSRWHWSQIGTAENLATSDWQVAHVASLLGNGDLALTFARRNLAAAEELGWGGWRLASAHEGMARAWATAGSPDRRNAHIEQAEQALADEADADSVELIRSQLNSIPT
jgi:hypothetical protein